MLHRLMTQRNESLPISPLHFIPQTPNASHKFGNVLHQRGEHLTFCSLNQSECGSMLSLILFLCVYVRFLFHCKQEQKRVDHTYPLRMSRIIFKGGAWSNKEDALLQAALAKYGMKNWDRVASMLENRKTPQQCKDRWFQYLDPSVNKGEWTADEEEKLVQLQELFPAQWELVASQIKGRKPWQCEQHFQALVEAAGGVANVAPDALIAELRNRRLQQGGPSTGGGAAAFDTAFETRAPRADAVDLDGKEQEMMATATARLANQDGKKQSRDSRQQQLKETSFLTTLQRGRELEASGALSISAKRRRQSALTEMMGDQDVGLDDEDHGAFTPVEVIQSSARRGNSKKTALVMAKGAVTSEEDGTTSLASGLDLSHLFPSTVGTSSAPAIMPPPSALSLDWSVLGNHASIVAEGGDVPPLVEPRTIVSPATLGYSILPQEEQKKPAVHQQGEEEVQEEVVDAPFSFDDRWRAVAQSLIEEECAAMDATAGKNTGHDIAHQQASMLVQESLAQLYNVHAALTIGPSPPVIDIQQLNQDSDARLSSPSPPSIRKMKRGRQGLPNADLDIHRLAATISDENYRTVELQSRIAFYRDVCHPAEEVEMNRRLDEAHQQLECTRRREAALQSEFSRCFGGRND